MPRRDDISTDEVVKLYLEGHDAREVGRMLGTSLHCVANRLHKRKIPIRPKRIDIVGDRFGKLLVKEFVGYDKAKRALWKCACDCGGEHTCLAGNLKNGTVSYCKKCKKNTPYEAMPDGCAIPDWYWGSLKSGARARNYEFLITPDYASNLLTKQNLKCNLTGVVIGFCKRPEGKATASLDRIDSSLPYQEGNIQWVHKDINRFKNNYSQEKFIDMCSQVTNFHKSQQDKETS